MRRKWLFASWLFGLAGCLGVCGQAPAGEAGITAVADRPVHPVLVRNEHNGLLRVVIESSRDALQLKAIRVSLEGTDSFNDLEVVELFSTAEQREFSTAQSWGKPQRAAPRVSFEGNWPLRRGTNVLWVSCRLQPLADLSHRVAAECISLVTSEGSMVPTDASPGIRQRIGIALRRHQDDGVHTYRIPALTTTARGTLLCVYDMRRRARRDLQEDIDIGLSRSVDGGRSWEPVRVIMDMGEFGGLPQEQNGCSDPGLIVDHQTGEIFCFAVWMNGKPGKHQWDGDGSEPGYEIGKSAQFLMVRSRDDGLTWSAPENLTRQLKKPEWWLFAPSPQQGFQLADGTLVMPAQGRDAEGGKFSTLMTSRDHGATWSVGTPAYPGGSECQAVRLSDGSIMLNIRNDREKFRAVFVTSDLGQTWRAHETNRNTLIEPTCNASLLRVDWMDAGRLRHVLLFANPHSQQARTHQTVQASLDDGRSWPKEHHVLLDEGRGAGYASLTRIDGGRVGIVYEGSQAHLVFQTLLLDELCRPAR
jgi:sialidase-1